MTEVSQSGNNATAPACDNFVADNAKNLNPTTPKIDERAILAPPDFIYGAKEIARFLGLTERIDNNTAHAIHVPFKQEPLKDAIAQFSHDNLPQGSLVYYTRDTYQKWGFVAS